MATRDPTARITVVGDTAEVALSADSVGRLPKELAKLQVSGTDLAIPTPCRPPDNPDLPVLWLNPTLTMSAGKEMAQVATRRSWPGGDSTSRHEKPGRATISTSPCVRPTDEPGRS